MSYVDWNLKQVENLPRVSYDYAFPYLNQIQGHPEIYDRKALFLDLVCTGIHDSFCINDDAIKFIRNQLKKNGTLDAMEQGRLAEFIIPEAEKENYSFSRLEIRRGEEERASKYYLKWIKRALLTKDEKYDACIKNDNNFDSRLLSLYLKDESKTEQILDHYRKVRDNLLKNNENPYTHDGFVHMGSEPNLRLRDFEEFAVNALEAGNKAIALEVISDMAKYSDFGMFERIIPGTPFLDFMNNPYPVRQATMKELIEKNGIQSEVEQIMKEHNERPDVKFQLHANPLERARKKFAKWADEMAEKTGMEKTVQKFTNGKKIADVKLSSKKKAIEKAISDKLFGKVKE